MATQKTLDYGNYGVLHVYELHNGDLQIAVPEFYRMELEHELSENEYEYIAFDEIIYEMLDNSINKKPEFDYDWDALNDQKPALALGSKVWKYLGEDHPSEEIVKKGFIIFEAVEYGCEEPKTVSPEQETTAMNKITKIVLHNDMVNIHRGDSWHTYYPKQMTDASRIRLNDVLIVWSETGRIESRPYVGPGWCINTLRVVDVPAKNKATVAKIEQRVTEVGIERLRHQGSAFNEVDFVCGAGAALDALGLFGYVPALWVFGPLSGMKIFTLEEESIGENA